MNLQETKELIARLELESDAINNELIAFYKGVVVGIESVKASVDERIPSFLWGSK
jgi:hypothetical protein